MLVDHSVVVCHYQELLYCSPEFADSISAVDTPAFSVVLPLCGLR